MKTIGIFDAKTRFPSLCSQVARSGVPVLVQRRGRPLVVISPAEPATAEGHEDIYTAWKKWEESAPREESGSEFPEVWKVRADRRASPLQE